MSIIKKIFNPKWRFDFKVSIDNHVVSIEPGKQISIPVRVELVRGKSQSVRLDVNTNWESVGLTAKLLSIAIDPSQKLEATMIIRASHNTPPDSYLFTVRGGAEGTFGTSEDAITVIVEPKNKKNREKQDELNMQDNLQPQQLSNTAEPSFDLGKLFTSTPKVLPYEAIKEGSGSIWPAFFVLMGITIGGGLLLAAILKGGGGTCPASAPIDCDGGCCPAGDGGRTDVCCPGNKCTSNGKCGSSTPVNPGGCPPLDCGERGLGGAVPKQCPCPSGCPYESVTNLPGYKQCSSF